MDKNLSWFIGPKAENISTFEDLLNVMVDWRNNYFSDAPLLSIKSNLHVSSNEGNNKLYQNVHELLASHWRNFPFYTVPIPEKADFLTKLLL